MSRLRSWLAPAALFWRAFGQMLIVSFVPLQLVQSGARDYIALGVIYGLPFFMQLLFAPLWGRLMDHIRLPGLLAAVGFFGYAAMEAGTAVSSSQSGILLALAFGGILGAALSPAAKWQALRAQDGHRTLALALRAEAAGWLVGAILPAAFAALGSGVFQLLGATAVATALCAPLFWRTPAAAPSPHTPAGGRPALHRSPAFWLLLAGCFAQFLVGETFYAFYGVYLTRHLGGPLWLYSGTLSVTTLLGLLLYGLAARTTSRTGAGPVLIATSLVYLVSYGLLALFPTVPMAAITFSIPAFSFFRTAATIGISRAASGRSGTAMGMLDAAEGLASSVGGPLSGIFVSAFSLAVLPLLPLVLSAVAALPLFAARRLPAQGAGGVAEQPSI